MVDDDFQTIVVKRDDGPNIRFKGVLRADASNSPDKARPDYSGITGRSSELNLYQTEAGKFVCQRIGRTQWVGEHTRYEVQVCETRDEVFAFFGGSRLAKQLYDRADLEFVKDVE